LSVYFCFISPLTQVTTLIWQNLVVVLNACVVVHFVPLFIALLISVHSWHIRMISYTFKYILTLTDFVYFVVTVYVTIKRTAFSVFLTICQQHIVMPVQVC